VLVRIAYAADLPSPDEVLRSLADDDGSTTRPGNGGSAASALTGPGPSGLRPPAPQSIRSTPATARDIATARDSIARLAEPTAAPAPPPIAVARFEELIALAADKRDLVVKTVLERDVRLVRFEDGRLEVALEPGAATTLVGELSRKLSQWTGKRWMVVVSGEQGVPSLKAQAEARKAELVRGVTADPLVQAVLNRFPGAEIVDVRRPPDATMPVDLGAGDEMIPEPPPDDE
jgi:DNA polymerase III subunit gamma/tau